MIYFTIIWLLFCTTSTNFIFASVLTSTRTCVRAIDGVLIDLISVNPSKSTNKAPLLFIHGSGAGGWIWNEHWLEYFASAGFPCLAVSMRGSKVTGTYNYKRDPVRIEEHINDMKRVLKYVITTNKQKPWVLGHSFGGLVLTRLCEDEEARGLMNNCVWMSTLPPSGQGKMVQRFIRTRFFKSLTILRGFVFGEVFRNPKLNRKIFYDDSIDLESVKGYMDRLALDAEIVEDLADVETNQTLPSKASWLPHVSFKRFVLGSSDDMIVDPRALEEQAEYVGANGVNLIQGPGHNIMLGGRWKIGAEALMRILEDERGTNFETGHDR